MTSRTIPMAIGTIGTIEKTETTETEFPIEEQLTNHLLYIM